jgi:hypothetical protein
MSKWPEGWRPNTLEEAQEYLAEHAGDDGDPETAAACQIEIEKHTPGARTPIGGQDIRSPFTPPPDDLVEEKGAD